MGLRNRPAAQGVGWESPRARLPRGTEGWLRPQATRPHQGRRARRERLFTLLKGSRDGPLPPAASGGHGLLPASPAVLVRVQVGHPAPSLPGMPGCPPPSPTST